MIVVPLEPLLEMEVLACHGIRWVEIDVETSVFETIVEFLDLSVVFRMVGFVTDVDDPCLGARAREARAPLPSTIRPNGTDNEWGMSNDILEEGNGGILCTIRKELREGEPGTIIETIEADSWSSPPWETRIHLDFFPDFFLHISLRRWTREPLGKSQAPMALPNAPDGAWMHSVFFRECRSDVVDVPIRMGVEHLQNYVLCFWR